MAIALVLVLVVAGSILFHLFSPWWWTPIASNWDYIDHTIIITFWITGVVFAAVVLFMAYCVWRFRHREGQHARTTSRRTRGWNGGSPSITGVGVAAMLVPGLFVWSQFVTVPDDATEVEVVGQQWQWSFRLPGKDGKLGTSDTARRHRRQSARPDRQTIRTARTMSSSKRPTCICRSASRSRCCCARSTCCMISTCREFRAKMDMIPGSVTYFWFTPTRTGTFEVLCAELCGLGHAFMRGSGRGRYASRTTRPGSGAADIRATVGAPADGRGGVIEEMIAARLADEGLHGKARQRSSPAAKREVFLWSMSHLARSMPSRPPKSRKSNSIIRTAGGRNTSSPRTPRSSPSSIAAPPSPSAWWRWCCPG